ncbi:redox-active disulfide protein 2 [Clostridium novyi A str. 4570]|uniref:Redox-active disulfide protein 2 n=1 Tax=Clostridium novyi A str. 4570 TaxID=1444290 RepID=A0AA88ZNE4_CLONO|nr:thioredoxin family protein [Clostridium novyi]KGN02395.1 redox-active disulfide protein 2 [Clostridium novyi A str. 4570]
MRLFRKKEKFCCKSFSDHSGEIKNSRIKVLGSGCKKCNELESIVKEVLNEMNLKEEISHITDFAQIATYGVMSTPALVVDNKVVSYGKVLTVKEARELLKKLL